MQPSWYNLTIILFGFHPIRQSPTTDFEYISMAQSMKNEAPITQPSDS